MGTKIVSGKDIRTAANYWTIILTERDAIRMEKAEFDNFKHGLQLIEQAINSVAKGD